MVGTPHLQPAPSLSADTCVHAVTRSAAAGSVFAFLALIIRQRGLDVVAVVVDHQVNVFEGE